MWVGVIIVRVPRGVVTFRGAFFPSWSDALIDVAQMLADYKADSKKVEMVTCEKVS